MQPGDDVIVDFEDHDHPGEVVKIEHGWAFCLIVADPDLDYGAITPRMSPYSTVAVPLVRVRPRD